MATLGEAFINVRADLKPFTKDLGKELKVILDAAEKEVQKRGKEIGKKLSDSMRDGARANASKIGDVIGKEVKKKKIKIETEVDRDPLQRSARTAFDGVETLAKSAGTSIAKRIGDGLTSAGRFVSGAIENVFSSIGMGAGGKGGPSGAAIAATAIGALVSILLALIPAAITAAQAVGGLAAALALVPAAGVAILGVTTLLTTAFNGFDKAWSAALSGNMDDFKKALEDLTPSARRVARSIQPLLTAFQKLVQEQFFRQIAGGVNDLVKALDKGGFLGRVGQISRLLGTLLNDFLEFLASAEGMDMINSVMDAVRDSLIIMRPALKDFAKAFGVIIRAGATVLPTVAKVVATLAEHFAKFIEDADRSGALAAFFTNLGLFFQNLGPAVEGIIGVLGDFLGWAVKNPGAILSLANAFVVLADALAKGFSDPQVIASIAAIAAILASIPPETWSVVATAILKFATAIGIFGAVLLWIMGLIAKAQKAFEDWISGLLGGLDKGVSGIKGKAKAFMSAGKHLMDSFFEGIKNAAKGAVNVGQAIVNKIKSGINASIGAINRGLDRGFGILGVNFPDIPFLAKGGVITGPTLAVVGEKGPEAVVPLNNPSAAASVLMKSGLSNLMAPIVQVFLGTEQLEQRMYKVVANSNTAQATSLRHGPRTA